MHIMLLRLFVIVVSHTIEPDVSLSLSLIDWLILSDCICVSLVLSHLQR